MNVPVSISNRRALRWARGIALTGALILSVLVVPSAPAAGTTGGGGTNRTVLVDEGQSIQAAIDDARPGTTIRVRGNHVEQLLINKDGIKLLGGGATLSMPENPVEGPCGPTLICVIPDNENNFDDPFDEANVYLRDVRISGFTLSNPVFDSIALYFTEGARVDRNRVTGSGCNGIWMLFGNDFRIERNRVAGSADCGNIEVAASNGGTISRNTSTDSGFAGINLDDVSNTEVSRNRATGNCIGIVAADSPGPLPSSTVSITRNTASGNNTVCYPFGPPEVGGPPVGVTGILVVGVADAVVSGNTAHNNVSTDPAGTITAGGIAVQDFVTDEGTNVSSGVVVDRNRANGNSTIAGRLDISVTSGGTSITVTRNRCRFSAPDASWCIR